MMYFNVGLLFVGKHLQYIRAFPFDHHIPGDFHTELQDVVNKVDVPPDDNFQQLTSSKRSNFYSIAKNHSSADDDGETSACLINYNSSSHGKMSEKERTLD